MYINDVTFIEYTLVEIDLGIDLSTIMNSNSWITIQRNMKYNSSLRRIKSRDRYYCEFTHKNNTKYLVHRYLMQHAAEVIDHINGDSLDNRLCNLRLSSYSNNSLNRKVKNYSNMYCNLHHISYKPRCKSFYVRIVKDKIEHGKGGFKTIEEAILFHKKILPKLYPVEYKSIFKLNGYVEE